MPGMSSSGPPVLPCPVCGTAVTAGYSAPCPTCRLPAAGQSALVVARIGATLTELTHDRDALLATLRAAAPGTAPAPAPAYPPAARLLPVAPPPAAPPVAGPPPTAPPVAVPPVPVPPPVRLPARRLSPQQVLLGLGALLLVAGAIAFVALAWTRLGLAFQAGVMLAVTAAACGVSAWAAHRGLRATEEALAAAGAALLAVALGGALAKGLRGVAALPVRVWVAMGCGVLVLAGIALGRLTPTTASWPLVALLAVQPAPFLVMTSAVLDGPVGAAAAYAVAAVDVAVALRLRRTVAPVAAALAATGALGGTALGLSVAASAAAPSSWAASGVLAAGGAGVMWLLRVPRVAALLPRPALLGAAVGTVTGLGVAGSLHATGRPGGVAAGALPVPLPPAAVLLAGSGLGAGASTGGAAALGAGGALVLLEDERLGPLAAVLLAATVPAVL